MWFSYLLRFISARSDCGAGGIFSTALLVVEEVFLRVEEGPEDVF